MYTLPPKAQFSSSVGNGLFNSASLDLHFAKTKSLVDATTGSNLVDFTRASSGTYVGSDGLIKTAVTNEARFDHAPVTGESLGLLVEEARTNGIRNNTMVGASTPSTLPTNWNVASSVAGINFEVVGVGTESGISYVDIRIHGTPAANGTTQISFEQNATNAAASGETWTITSYCRLMAGTLPPFLYLRARVGGSGGSFLEVVSTDISPTSNPLISQRFTNVAVLSNASTAFITARIDAAVFSGVPVDYTFRIGMPQLEKGAFATSVIPTTSSTVTRAADVATDTSTGANIRTLYAQFRSPASGTRPIASLDDNTANERIELLTSGTDPKLLVTDGGSAVADLDSGAVVAGTSAKLATRFANDDYAAVVNGGTIQTDTAGTLPTVDRLRVGSDQAGNYFSGTIARLTGWNTPLPNETLQTITQ